MKLTFLKAPLLLLGILLAASFPSCFDAARGNGDLVTEIRKEKDFHALDISIPGTVEVRTGSDYAVVVTCEENIIAYLETFVKDGVLDISFDRSVWDVDGLKVTVTAPAWDAFDISGSCNVNVKDKISGTELKTSISGSGDLDIFEAVFNKTQFAVTGSGNLSIKGSASDLDANVSGSGNVDALDFPVKTARASVTGSGNIRLDVSDELNASVSGSGDILYKGSPKVNSNVSGSGRVKKI